MCEKKGQRRKCQFPTSLLILLLLRLGSEHPSLVYEKTTTTKQLSYSAQFLVDVAEGWGWEVSRGGGGGGGGGEVSTRSN